MNIVATTFVLMNLYSKFLLIFVILKGSKLVLVSAITFQGNFIKTDVDRPNIKAANERVGQRQNKKKILFKQKISLRQFLQLLRGFYGKLLKSLS